MMCCNARRKIQAEGRVADLEAENARLQAHVEEAEQQARYCNQCRSANEAPLGDAVYICFWCGDGFCHEHAAKHFGAEHGGREDRTAERDGYKALAERQAQALAHVFVTAEERVKRFPADGYWLSVRDTAALAATPEEERQPTASPEEIEKARKFQAESKARHELDHARFGEDVEP